MARITKKAVASSGIARVCPGRGRGRMAARVTTVVVIAASIGTLAFRAWTGSGRPGGDPDGHLLARLRTEAGRVIPPGGVVVERHDFPVEWDMCDGRRDTGGWQPVRVLLTVRVPPEAGGGQAVAEALTRSGWTDLHAPGDARRWSKRLPEGQLASLTVLAEGVEHTYVMTAQPPGPEPTGC